MVSFVPHLPNLLFFKCILGKMWDLQVITNTNLLLFEIFLTTSMVHLVFLWKSVVFFEKFDLVPLVLPPSMSVCK